MHIAMHKIKPSAKFTEHVLYVDIVNKRECCRINAAVPAAPL